MNYVDQTIGWGALLIALAGVGFQHEWLCALAVVFGIVAMFFKDIRGMGITSISIGVIGWLMTTLYSSSQVFELFQ